INPDPPPSFLTHQEVLDDRRARRSGEATAVRSGTASGPVHPEDPSARARRAPRLSSRGARAAAEGRARCDARFRSAPDRVRKRSARRHGLLRRAGRGRAGARRFPRGSPRRASRPRAVHGDPSPAVRRHPGRAVRTEGGSADRRASRRSQLRDRRGAHPMNDVARDLLEQSDPQVYRAIVGEEIRQGSGRDHIPSENHPSPEVLAALGSVLTDKYSEGYPGRRYYGGQTNTDAVERLACERARQLFCFEHANVQPLSGSPMNQATYLAFLSPGDTVLAMDLSHGGHLTHGAPVSHMGKIFNFVRYKTHPEDRGRLAAAPPTTLGLAVYTSYPRDYDYADFKRVADVVGALTMADVSHVGGLI